MYTGTKYQTCTCNCKPMVPCFLCLVVLSLASSGLTQCQFNTGITDTMVAFISHWNNEFQRGDWNWLDQHTTSSFVWETSEGYTVGRSQFQSMQERWFEAFPDTFIGIQNMYVQDEWIHVELLSSATFVGVSLLWMTALSSPRLSWKHPTNTQTSRAGAHISQMPYHHTSTPTCSLCAAN